MDFGFLNEPQRLREHGGGRRRGERGGVFRF